MTIGGGSCGGVERQEHCRRADHRTETGTLEGSSMEIFKSPRIRTGAVL